MSQAIICLHLHSGFGEVDLHGNLFTGVDVRIVSLLELHVDCCPLTKTKIAQSNMEKKYLKSSLELLQLSRGEGCANSPLLPFLRQNAVVPRVHLVWQSSCEKSSYINKKNFHVRWKDKRKCFNKRTITDPPPSLFPLFQKW